MTCMIFFNHKVLLKSLNLFKNRKSALQYGVPLVGILIVLIHLQLVVVVVVHGAQKSDKTF